MIRAITEEALSDYAASLAKEERAAGTVEKYMRDVRRFALWLDGAEATEERVTAWKKLLLEQGYAAVTINSMLAALNSFFRFAGWTQRARFLKIQRRLFRDGGRVLTRSEYERLLAAAHRQRKEQTELLMETICATGIRVSEVRFFTVETIRPGRAEIMLKGKIRTILIPDKLCRKLLRFAKQKKIASGEIFITSEGRSLSRRQIWGALKSLCGEAGVAPAKVFPHNLRHLFASVFYRACHDIVQLADVLGHSSIETTRIYLMTSGLEYRKKLDRLGLVT